MRSIAIFSLSTNHFSSSTFLLCFHFFFFSTPCNKLAAERWTKLIKALWMKLTDAIWVFMFEYLVSYNVFTMRQISFIWLISTPRRCRMSGLVPSPVNLSNEGGAARSHRPLSVPSFLKGRKFSHLYGIINLQNMLLARSQEEFSQTLPALPMSVKNNIIILLVLRITASHLGNYSRPPKYGVR